MTLHTHAKIRQQIHTPISFYFDLYGQFEFNCISYLKRRASCVSCTASLHNSFVYMRKDPTTIPSSSSSSLLLLHTHTCTTNIHTWSIYHKILFRSVGRVEIRLHLWLTTCAQRRWLVWRVGVYTLTLADENLRSKTSYVYCIHEEINPIHGIIDTPILQVYPPFFTTCSPHIVSSTRTHF